MDCENAAAVRPGAFECQGSPADPVARPRERRHSLVLLEELAWTTRRLASPTVDIAPIDDAPPPAFAKHDDGSSHRHVYRHAHQQHVAEYDYLSSAEYAAATAISRASGSVRAATAAAAANANGTSSGSRRSAVFLVSWLIVSASRTTPAERQYQHPGRRSQSYGCAIQDPYRPDIASWSVQRTIRARPRSSRAGRV